jgi:hypothetical protein
LRFLLHDAQTYISFTHLIVIMLLHAINGAINSRGRLNVCACCAIGAMHGSRLRFITVIYSLGQQHRQGRPETRRDRLVSSPALYTCDGRAD